ncbi:CU044_2847 family protein [Lentzea sp. CA-135723]|uniref:CU044_2847 family protein n=1 Tax=Lentzea sp. CA-135723 TaxID=3239950 RepID=UPI003D90D9D7
MAQLVSVPLENGGALLIEAAGGLGSVPVSGAGKVVVQASDTVRKAMGGIRAAADEVLTELRSTEEPPSKVAVRFGVKVTADAEFVVAASAAEANFSVTIEWNDAGQAL